MNRFEKVKQILDDSVGGEDIGQHGPFWRGTTREQFVVKRVFGQQLVVVGDGAGSKLVMALKGEAPFGSDVGTSGAFFRRIVWKDCRNELLASSEALRQAFCKTLPVARPATLPLLRPRYQPGPLVASSGGSAAKACEIPRIWWMRFAL